MSEIETPQEFFEKTLPNRFKPEKAKGINIVVQANIVGNNGGNWIVTIRDQQIEAKKGTNESPTLTVGMAETDFMDIVNSRLSAEKAFFTGKIKFKGDISLALKLRDIGFL
jgi:putative sterol carrier protein